MGTGICLFLGGKMGFHALGLGFISKKNNRKLMGMGLRFEQDSYIDDGICALGQWDLVKIWAGKWETSLLMQIILIIIN